MNQAARYPRGGVNDEVAKREMRLRQRSTFPSSVHRRPSVGEEGKRRIRCNVLRIAPTVKERREAEPAETLIFSIV